MSILLVSFEISTLRLFFFFLSASFLGSANSFLPILLCCLLFSEFLHVCSMVFLNGGDYFIKCKRFMVKYLYHNIHVPVKFSSIYSLSVNHFFSFSTCFSLCFPHFMSILLHFLLLFNERVGFSWTNYMEDISLWGGRVQGKLKSISTQRLSFSAATQTD